jgi:hypothetical protein
LIQWTVKQLSPKALITESQKSWYQYTDESGKCWRIQISAALAEIGGLMAAAALYKRRFVEPISPQSAH